jgi:hypothetical protein
LKLRAQHAGANALGSRQRGNDEEENVVATMRALLRGERPANVVNPEVFR